MNGMNPRSRCIVCKTTWGDGDPEDGYTDGLCPTHVIIALVPIYRHRQRQEGHFDCFARSNGFCDQDLCKYRQLCLNPARPRPEEIEAVLQAHPIDRFSSHNPHLPRAMGA